MPNIYVLADGPLASLVGESILGSSWQIVSVTENLRSALLQDYGAPETSILVAEDRILQTNMGLMEHVARLSCRKILVGALTERGVARRALLLGVIDVVEPATIVRALPEVLKRLDLPELGRKTVARIIGIYSAKGGVGKSTVALNLAVAVARLSRYPVALIDVDFLGDLASMLRTPPGVSLADLVDALEGGMAPEAIMQSLTVLKDLRLTIISAPVHPQQSERIRPEHLNQIFDLLRHDHSYIFVDFGTSLHDVTLAALDRCDDIVVLAAPEQVALSAVAKSLQVLRRLYASKLQVVLNRGDTLTGLVPEKVEELLGQNVVRILPSGGTAPVKAANQGRPLVLSDPQNGFAQAIVAWANALVTNEEGAQRRRKHWLTGWRT